MLVSFGNTTGFPNREDRPVNIPTCVGSPVEALRRRLMYKNNAIAKEIEIRLAPSVMPAIAPLLGCDLSDDGTELGVSEMLLEVVLTGGKNVRSVDLGVDARDPTVEVCSVPLLE